MIFDFFKKLRRKRSRKSKNLSCKTCNYKISYKLNKNKTAWFCAISNDGVDTDLYRCICGKNRVKTIPKFCPLK